MYTWLNVSLVSNRGQGRTSDKVHEHAPEELEGATPTWECVCEDTLSTCDNGIRLKCLSAVIIQKVNIYGTHFPQFPLSRGACGWGGCSCGAQAEAIIRHQLWGAFCMGFYSRKGPEGIFLVVAREGFRACVLSLMLGSSWASASSSCLSLYRAMGDF